MEAKRTVYIHFPEEETFQKLGSEMIKIEICQHDTEWDTWETKDHVDFVTPQSPQSEIKK